MSSRSYVIPGKFGFGLYLNCYLLMHKAGRHLASCEFMAKKDYSDFVAERSNYLDVLQLATKYSPLCSLDVALFKSVSCVHSATSSAKRMTCGAPTTDARSSMVQRKRSGDRTDPCGTPCFNVTFWLLTPSNVNHRNM